MAPFAITKAAEPGSWLATWQPAVVYLAGRNSVNTRRSYGTAIRQFVELARVELAGVVEWHIAGFKLHLVNRNLSPRTIRHRLGALRSFFTWAIERRYHPGPNPALGIPLPPRRGQAGRALAVGELGALLGHCRNGRDRAMVALMALCGLRVGEVVALERADYTSDLGRPVVIIRHGKGGRDRRVPAMGAAAFVDAYLADGSRVLSGPLFQALGGGGGGIGARHLARIVAGAAWAAGLGRLSPSDLRRTFATQALDRGVPVPEVQAVMGHSNMTTTAGYYRGLRSGTGGGA